VISHKKQRRNLSLKSTNERQTLKLLQKSIFRFNFNFFVIMKNNVFNYEETDVKDL